MRAQVIKDAIKDEADAVAPGRWRLEQSAAPESRRMGWNLELAPVASKGAALSVHVPEGLGILDVTLGEGGHVELMTEDPDVPDESALAELRRMVRVIVAGEFSEELWYRGDQLVKAKGRISCGADVEVMSWREAFAAPWGWRKETREYDPY